jgi:hypothetical protein
VSNRFFVAVLLSTFLSPFLLGGSIKQWHMTDVERSPLLIVGRVQAVRKLSDVADYATPGGVHTSTMTAEVAVLRSHFLQQNLSIVVGSSINIRYFAYGPNQTLVVNGQPLVNFKPGDTLLLPLLANDEPASKPWALLGVDGIGLTMHVRADLPENAANAKTGREFILRELANSLSNGTPEEASSAGGYVHDQGENLARDMMPLLERNIGVDKRRWAVALVSLMGQDHPNIAELRSGDWRDVNWNPSADHGYSIATAILKTLPVSSRSDQLIIAALMERASFAPECMRIVAAEYATNQYFLDTLREALDRRQPGAVYVAWSVFDKGQQPLPQHVLKSAQEIADAPAKDTPTPTEILDRQAAASLLRQ